MVSARKFISTFWGLSFIHILLRLRTVVQPRRQYRTAVRNGRFVQSSLQDVLVLLFTVAGRVVPAAASWTELWRSGAVWQSIQEAGTPDANTSRRWNVGRFPSHVTAPTFSMFFALDGVEKLVYLPNVMLYICIYSVRPEGKRPIGRPRRRWMDSSKMDLRQMGWGDMDWLI
jgi:hypothetical protein